MRYLTLFALFLLIACHKPEPTTQPLPPDPIDSDKCWTCEIETLTPLWDTVWDGTREVEQVCGKTEKQIRRFEDSLHIDEPKLKRNVRCR